MKYITLLLVIVSLSSEVLADVGSGRQLAIVKVELMTGELINGYYIINNGGYNPAPSNGFWVVDEKNHQHLYLLSERDSHSFQGVTGDAGKHRRVYFAQAKDSNKSGGHPENLSINERKSYNYLVGEVSYSYVLHDTVTIYKVLETYKYGREGYGYRFDLSMPYKVIARKIKSFRLVWNPSDEQLKSIEKGKQKRNQKYPFPLGGDESGDWAADEWFHKTLYVKYLKSIRG